MTDYKSGKWAKEIAALQKQDGSWGYFHSLSMPVSRKDITTEQAINRLARLGFTKRDEPIQKALEYMHACLQNTFLIPDRRETRMDWNIFVELMLSVCIRKFTLDDPLANGTAKKWRAVAEAAFKNGRYDAHEYIDAFYHVFEPRHGTKKRHKELLRVDYYYPISILAGEVDESIEKAFFDYTMESATGYYYGFTGSVLKPPEDFCSRQASRYLAAVELYCAYPNSYCKAKLKPVVDWLYANRNVAGRWDMGAGAKDGTYFPLSDSWRTAGAREEDCTYRVEKIITSLE